jgi:hypothetical protein
MAYRLYITHSVIRERRDAYRPTKQKQGKGKKKVLGDEEKGINNFVLNERINNWEAGREARKVMRWRPNRSNQPLGP